MLQFLPRIYLDFASFWIGVIAASLAWFLYLRLKPQADRIQQRITDGIKSIRERLATRTTKHLQQKTLEYAQSQHLGASFCPLDEVLIPPRILASPHQIGEDGHPPDVDTLQEVLPFTADFPEFAAEYRYPTLSVQEAIRGGANIAILGRPGSGKTVALSHLASLLARKEIDSLSDRVPLFIDAHDIVHELPGNQIISIITAGIKANSFYRQAGPLDEIIQELFEEKMVFLLVDSVDQLPRQETILITSFLSEMLQKFPWIRIATTGSTYYVDGLLETDLIPVALSGWGTPEKELFTKKWKDVYHTYGSPQNSGAPSTVFTEGEEDLLVQHWLEASKTNHTPLEYTLQIWGMFAGDSLGSRLDQTIQAYLQRLTTTHPTSSLAPLHHIARFALNNGTYSFRREDIQDWLNNSPRDLETHEDTSPIWPLLNTCREEDILRLGSDRRYRFTHPTIAGYLAASGQRNNPGIPTRDDQWKFYWSLAAEASRFTAANLDSNFKLPRSLLGTTGNEILAENIIHKARMMTFLPKGSAHLDRFRKLITKSILDAPLLETKLRLSTILANAGDPDAESIFRFLLTNPDVSVRQVAVLGCGYMRSSKAVPQIIEQLGEDHYLDMAACFALVQIGTPSALEAVANLLISGDEVIRRAAAEALANHPREGHPTLKDASEVEQLTIRHAAVFGLKRIRQPWAQDILDEMRIEDEEWLVRNAAQQAYEYIQGNSPFTPEPKRRKEDLPWLLSYHDNQEEEENLEISFDLLLKALTEGSKDHKISALYAARNEGFGSVFPVIYQNLLQDSYHVQRAAADTLWHLSLSGMEIPPPRDHLSP